MIHEQTPQLPLRGVGNAVQLFWTAALLGSVVGCFSGVDSAVRIAATRRDFAHTLDLAR